MIKMGRKSNIELNNDFESETKTMPESKLQEDVQMPMIVFEFEDFLITKEDNKYTIDKLTGGISDSCYARVATGQDKNWTLAKMDDLTILSGDVHGNRSFHWEGNLEPGTYILKTGRGNNTTIRRIPGRFFRLIFSIE